MMVESMSTNDEGRLQPVEGGGRLRIVLLNYNQPSLTAESVRTAIAQGYAPKDVVVVDNGSSRESYGVLEALLPDEVVLVRSEMNLGFAGGNNLGARSLVGLADPEYVLFMNNDACFRTPQDAGVLVNALAQNPELLAASPMVSNAYDTAPPEVGIQVRRITNYFDELVAGSWFLRRLPGGRSSFRNHTYADQRPYLVGRTYEVECINGCCFLVKWPFLASIGFLDERTFLYSEELLLGWTIRQRCGKCALVTSVVIDHVGGSTTGKLNLRLYREGVRSELVYLRHYLGCGFARRVLLVVIRAVDYVTKWLMLRARSVLARASG
jgi:GT2 family glycosyltransferase